MKTFYPIFSSLQKILSSLKQPLDRFAIVVISILTILISILLLTGDTTSPKIRDFSWNDKQIGSEDTGFILTFNRPMNPESVEKNLRINPPLPGKFSWSGRRMAYTLMNPAPYGIHYGLQLQEAQDKFYANKPDKKGGIIQPFSGAFRSRDRAFLYIGTTGEEKGRLMLVNLSSNQPKPIALTPKDLVIMDYQPYPQGDRVLFSANDQELLKSGLLQQQLFTVTTGLNYLSPGEEIPPNQFPGKIDKILDSRDYQNLKFDLSGDGKTIVVQRVNKTNPADFGPWMITEKEPPKRLEKANGGGDFLIRPDHQSIVISQRDGLAIIPLKSEEKEIEILPKFAQVLGFARDNSMAAYVKYNTDYTRSLFIAKNQGTPTEIFRIPGNIISIAFDPRRDTNGNYNHLYCLLTQRLTTEKYQEQPFISSLDLAKKTLTPLLLLPNNQPEINMSLSPDGLTLLFDETLTESRSGKSDQPRGEKGETISKSSLWVLSLMEGDGGENGQLKPEKLPFPGFHPRWIP